jgi:hypothetical protein
LTAVCSQDDYLNLATDENRFSGSATQDEHDALSPGDLLQLAAKTRYSARSCRQEIGQKG